MILDWIANPELANLHDVIDLDTGKPLDVPVWYADDETGVCWAYRHKKEGTGRFFYSGPDGDGIPYRFHARIRIVPKAEYIQADADAKEVLE